MYIYIYIHTHNAHVLTHHLWQLLSATAAAAVGMPPSWPQVGPSALPFIPPLAQRLAYWAVP